MTTELAHDHDFDDWIDRMVRHSESVRARASQACETSAIAITRSEFLRDRLQAARQTLAESTGNPSAGRTAVLELEPEPEPEPVPELPAPKPARGRRTREAHFAIASMLVDGEPWTVGYASLDIYHRGPDYEDPTEAIWEVQCTTAPATRRLEVRREYSLVIDARNGRRFEGRVFTQHSSSELCTLLDTGQPLVGLEAADYLN
jgi:hypothetical protein